MISYKAYCFDLDGTIYRGKSGIESAVKFVHYLQSKQIEPFYLTNNSSKTREMLQQMLKDIGIEAPLEHIYSSSLATAKYVAKICTDNKVNVIGEQGIRVALEQEGLEITDEQSNVLEYGCLSFCTKCAQGFYAVVNGDIVEADTPAELTKRIYEYIEENPMW